MARESNIRITVNQNGKVTVLADWTDTVQDEDLSAPVAVQPVKYLRGGSKAFDRGADLTTLSFVVCKEWPTLKAAWDAWINSRALTPTNGNLTWLTRGNGTLARYMADCVIQVKPLRRIGGANYLQYVCTGPKISTTPPANS